MSTQATQPVNRRRPRSARWRFATLVTLTAIVLAACSAESEASEPADSTTTTPTTTSTTQATTSTEATSTTVAEAPVFEHLSTEQPPETVAVEEAGQVPFYARIEPDDVIHDGDWAMVYFYRPTECIPADFDLLEFFHLPGDDDPGAFACGPPTADGVGFWENGPETDPAPVKMTLNGMGAVPVWFVNTDEYRAARQGGLTIGELESLELRKGTASEFHEILAPGFAISVSASGILEDGTTFLAQHRGVKGEPEVTNIEFSE